MDDILLDPLNAYKTCYREKFKENAENYFQKLVEESGTDTEENRATVKKYRQKTAEAQKYRAKSSRSKSLRGFLIFLIVAGLVALGAGIYLLVSGNTLAGALCVSLGAAAAIPSIVVIFAVLNKSIKRHEIKAQELEAEAQKLLAECWRQMAALNALFESNATKTLIELTVPLLKIDDNFDIRRFDYLNAKYGFTENHDPARSTVGILTGEILGNPFVVSRELVRTMGTQTYTGTLTIYWTTTSRDSQGRLQTHHHSQVLTASVTKPKPFYSEQTCLMYGNEAAPDLKFSHSPTHAEGMSEKSLQHFVEKGMKKIQKMESNALKNDNSNFTAMGNAEFDVLFNAFDRNNEVQFRLLFTPLAQKNMVSLMKDSENFGDDFKFDKRGCLNYVSSEHSQNWDMDTNYVRYQSYDIDDSHSRFMNFNSAYFKSLFFDLAPLLSVPLYQQHKPKEYIYKESYPRNYTGYEAECSANHMGHKYFCHEQSGTESILKASFLSKDGNSDKMCITAYSFRTENRVDYIPVWGGDGCMHSVPVYWVEYIPVTRDSVVGVKQLEMTDKTYAAKLKETPFLDALNLCGSNRVFVHGLLCTLLGNDEVSLDKALEKVI